jgi:hypothetical protein
MNLKTQQQIHQTVERHHGSGSAAGSVITIQLCDIATNEHDIQVILCNLKTTHQEKPNQD